MRARDIAPIARPKRSKSKSRHANLDTSRLQRKTTSVGALKPGLVTNIARRLRRLSYASANDALPRTVGETVGLARAANPSWSGVEDRPRNNIETESTNNKHDTTDRSRAIRPSYKTLSKIATERVARGKRGSTRWQVS